MARLKIARKKARKNPESAQNRPQIVLYPLNMDNIENVTIENAPADKFPRCPFCKKDLDKIRVKSSGWGFRGQKEIVMCPHCQSFLGYNAWKR